MQTRKQKTIQEIIKICWPEVDIETVAEAIAKVAKAVIEAIPEMVEAVSDTWEQVKEHLQTMPEDQYKELLEELTPEERGCVAAIRIAAKKEEQAEAGQESGKEI